MSKGLFYYYFTDKQDLYDEVVRVRVAALLGGTEFLEGLAGAAGQGPHAFWAAIEHHALAMLADLRSSPALHSLLADAFGSAGVGGDEDPPAGRASTGPRRSAPSHLTSVIRAGDTTHRRCGRCGVMVEP